MTEANEHAHGGKEPAGLCGRHRRHGFDPCGFPAVA